MWQATGKTQTNTCSPCEGFQRQIEEGDETKEVKTQEEEDTRQSEASGTSGKEAGQTGWEPRCWARKETPQGREGKTGAKESPEAHRKIEGTCRCCEKGSARGCLGTSAQ